jgi:hypothetical protein
MIAAIAKANVNILCCPERWVNPPLGSIRTFGLFGDLSVKIPKATL